MISIITSIYRSESYLPDFLKSINQIDIELNKMEIKHEFLLIPNDPSSKEISLIKEASKTNQSIRLFERRRESLYATWNFGVRQANYAVVTFWNVDDIRFSYAIKKLLEEIKTNEPTIAYFPFIYKRYIKVLNFNLLLKSKTVNVMDFDKLKFSKEMHVGPFFATTKKAFEMNGMFDESFRIAGDYEWITRAVKNHLNFVKIDVLAGIFKNNGTSLSGSRSTLHSEENSKVIHLINKT